MKKNFTYKYFFGIVDFFIIYISFLLSLYVLRNDPSQLFLEFLLMIPDIIFILILFSIQMLLVFQYNGLYRLNVILNNTKHFVHLIKAIYYCSLQTILLVLLIDSKLLINSKLLIIFFFFISLALFFLIRLELLKLIFIRLSNSTFKRDVIIVGDGKSGRLLAAKLMYENPIGVNILGFIDDKNQFGEIIIGDKKNLGNFCKIPEIVKKYNPDELLISIESEPIERLFEVLDCCIKLKVPVRITSTLFEVINKRLRVEKYDEIPVINVSAQFNDRISLQLKRIFDIVSSTILIILLSPILILIAIVIKLSSPGPIIFKQSRIGLNFKEFQFYKFRSMTVLTGEDEEREKMMILFMKNGTHQSNDTKIINSKRVTTIGKILRKTSLDELPQLFNVLKGDMSLVGPRPCLPYEFENYEDWHKRRLNVIPGCTGVWQVWGRGIVDFKDSVILDVYYINNMSPWLDFQLIFQTIPVMLLSRGAK